MDILQQILQYEHQFVMMEYLYGCNLHTRSS